VLDELNLRAYPKTSGACGIHVFLPILENTFTYEDVRVFAQAVASIIVQRLPETATIERVVRKRSKHEVYVDFLQNVKGKTVASVYSPRAEPGAPVSTPLRWEEFRKPLDPKDYTIQNIFKRIDKYGDLFGPVLTDRQDISSFLRALRNRNKRLE
jgi:bifunctional non-homologous end joining protein LigD